jgi:hypothetical protein
MAASAEQAQAAHARAAGIRLHNKKRLIFTIFPPDEKFEYHPYYGSRMEGASLFTSFFSGKISYAKKRKSL